MAIACVTVLLGLCITLAIRKSRASSNCHVKCEDKQLHATSEVREGNESSSVKISSESQTTPISAYVHAPKVGGVYEFMSECDLSEIVKHVMEGVSHVTVPKHLAAAYINHLVACEHEATIQVETDRVQEVKIDTQKMITDNQEVTIETQEMLIETVDELNQYVESDQCQESRILITPCVIDEYVNQKVRVQALTLAAGAGDVVQNIPDVENVGNESGPAQNITEVEVLGVDKQGGDSNVVIDTDAQISMSVNA